VPPRPTTSPGISAEAERWLAFADAYRMLANRISLLLALPVEALDRTALEQRLREIGTAEAGTEAG
jgi:hypothetical protein